MGSRRRRWLNQSTHSSVANSTTPETPFCLSSSNSGLVDLVLAACDRRTPHGRCSASGRAAYPASHCADDRVLDHLQGHPSCRHGCLAARREDAQGFHHSVTASGCEGTLAGEGRMRGISMPTRSSAPNDRIQASICRYPWRVAAKHCVPRTRSRSSTTAATCKPLWVSTPPPTRRIPSSSITARAPWFDRASTASPRPSAWTGQSRDQMVRPFSGHRHRRGKTSPQAFPGGRQVRGKTRMVDLSVGQATPGRLAAPAYQTVHRCESQAARKLAAIY